MMKKLFLISAFLFSLFYVPVNDIDLPKSAKKKVLKSFDSLWPDIPVQAILMEEVPVTDGEIGQKLRKLKLYRLKDDTVGLGFLFLSAAPSRYNDFDLMVIYNEDLEIIDTKVLAYREDWGGEIGSRRWLRQFQSKTSKDSFVVGDDIQGISGATISVKSATFAIRLMTQKLNSLSQTGLLD